MQITQEELRRRRRRRRLRSQRTWGYLDSSYYKILRKAKWLSDMFGIPLEEALNIVRENQGKVWNEGRTWWEIVNNTRQKNPFISLILDWWPHSLTQTVDF